MSLLTTLYRASVVCFAATSLFKGSYRLGQAMVPSPRKKPTQREPKDHIDFLGMFGPPATQETGEIKRKSYSIKQEPDFNSPQYYNRR